MLTSSHRGFWFPAPLVRHRSLISPTLLIYFLIVLFAHLRSQQNYQEKNYQDGRTSNSQVRYQTQTQPRRK